MDRLVEILAPWLPENKVMIGLDALGLASALYAAVVLYRKQQRNPMRLPYPPGPKPRFLVGNIPDMPESKEWLTFTEWGKTYGPLTMIDIMGRKFCILNTAKAASDLLDARSAIYSDRPAMPMVNDLMGWSFNMGLSPYDAKYVKKRKLFHHGFNARTSETYLPIQTREITLSLGKLLATPDQFDDVLRASIGAMLMKIAFGYNTTENDEFIRIAEEAQLAMVKAARMGQYLVDFFPILKHVPEWMPGADFQRVGREGLELANELLEKPFDWAKKQLDEGKAEPSFFTALMDGKGKWTEDPKEEQKMIRDATALMYATGADTILSSFLTFVLAMVHHPEVVRKAQEEVSRVVGSDRLPTLSDRASLPYIDAIVKETYRWESVIPLGVPHRLMKDDVYDGFFLPEGTTMIANQWGISHDEEMYPDAMSFKPERFIGVADSKAGGPRDPSTIAFGWGRRICPGRFLAENHLFIQIAAIFACFNIEPVIGADGKPVIPPRDYTNGLASRPEAFPCKITPRSEVAVELIRQSIAALED